MLFQFYLCYFIIPTAVRNTVLQYCGFHCIQQQQLPQSSHIVHITLQLLIMSFSDLHQLEHRKLNDQPEVAQWVHHLNCWLSSQRQ